MQRLPLDSAAGLARWEFLWPKTGEWLPAQIPGCIHSDLLRAGLIPDPFWGSNERDLQWIEREDWTYRARFDAPAELPACGRVELVADCLDTLATVTLNGRPIGGTENMFHAHRFPTGEALLAGGNELEIRFASPLPYLAERRGTHDAKEWNDPVGGCSNIRKQQCSFGWDWGPRLATCGVQGALRLEGWDGARLETVRVRQEHGAADNSVTLRILPRTGLDGGVSPTARARLTLNGELVAETQGAGVLTFSVENPQLWWPRGHGAPTLYDLAVDLLDAEGATPDTWRGRIGLRTVALDQTADEAGTAFRFIVNGRPIFAKGANWIPAHAFISRVTRVDYEELLGAAADVHMNMIRVWGGGVYEREEFYDVCDERGLLVWQDFMFACALYPGHRAEFVRLVEAEAAFQVRRLAHRACLALWCGNNEIEQMLRQTNATDAQADAYARIFHDVLPAAVAAHDGVTPYWPSSPHNPAGWREAFHSERGGDAHFWDVWHSRKPVKTYEERRFRFCSEFGMQSYSSPEVTGTFCPPDEWNIFSPAMENHQKNVGGNATIFDYVSRQYRFPKDYPSLAYLSQLNQLHCLKTGVEHFRRCQPHTMGALYWQLNDCWPVFSWSSLEFGGKPKALHYGARRFFAPALVSAHVPGDETAGIGNRLTSTIGEVHLWTVCDAPEPADGRLAWELHHLHEPGQPLENGERPVALRHGESVCRERLDFRPTMDRHGAANVFLHVRLEIDGQTVSEDTVFLTAPRHLNLPRAAVETTVASTAEGDWAITFRSPVFQHRVTWEVEGLTHADLRAEDRFFDLLPDRPRTVRGFPRSAAARALDAAAVRDRLRVLSLVDSYQCADFRGGGL